MSSAPDAIRCQRCGDEDGPFAGTPADAVCEPCINRQPAPTGEAGEGQ